MDAGEEEEWEQVVSAHVEALVCCARSRARRGSKAHYKG